MSTNGRRRDSKRARAIPVAIGSRTAQAYRVIKDEILSNRLHAGDAVPMERFVRELGLSRTPVREAVLQLAKDGFIDVRPRMGTFVSHLDLRQIQEMYEVRSLIEGHAARLATELIPPQALAALEDELRAQKTEGEIDSKAISEAGQNVHRLVVDSCGNQVLAQMILSLQDHFTRFRKLSLQIPEKVLSSHREHLEIVDALKRRDGGLAERLVHKHHQHAAQYLLESLLRRSADARGPRLTVAIGD
jgi:DNA-binding GntR family transcriptional regulator